MILKNQFYKFSLILLSFLFPLAKIQAQEISSCKSNCCWANVSYSITPIAIEVDIFGNNLVLYDDGAGANGMLAKFDSDWNNLWSINLGFRSYSLDSDVNGNIITSGFLLGGNGNSAIVKKIDSSTGTVISSISIDGIGDDRANWVSFSQSTNRLYVWLATQNSVDIDPGAGNYYAVGNYIAVYDNDLNFIVKLDIPVIPSFNPQFHIDKFGNIIVTGSFYGNYETMSTQIKNMFIIKYDVNGNLIWTRHIVRSTDGVLPISLTTDNSGNIIVSGNILGDATAYFDSNIEVNGTGNSSDFFLAKFRSDQNGQPEFAFSIGNQDGTETSKKVVTDELGNIFVTGTFVGISTNVDNVDFDPSENEFYLGSSTFQAENYWVYVAKYKTNGEFSSAIRLQSDEAGSLDVYNSKDIRLIAKNTLILYSRSVISTHRIGIKPVINSFTPSQGIVECSQITVYGENFESDPNNNKVTLNGIVAPIVSSSENSITFITPNTYNYNYKIAVTNQLNSCVGVSSDILYVTSNGKPSSILSGSSAICKNETTSIRVDLMGSQPWNLTYTDGTTPVTISGITTTPYFIDVSPTSTKTYSIVALEDSNCSALASDINGIATITVNPLPTISISPSSATICSGGSMVLNASGASSYTWSPISQLDPNSPTTGPIVTAKPSVTKTFTVTGTDAKGCKKSKNVKVWVNTITPGSIGYDQSICSGGDPMAFDEISAPTGSGTLSYQWQSSSDNLNYEDISGAINNIYEAPSGLVNSTYYKRLDKSTLNGITCMTETPPVVVTTNSTSIDVQPSSIYAAVCRYWGFAPLTVEASGTDLSYEWYSNSSNSTSGGTLVGTGPSFIPPSSTISSKYYYAKVYGTCGSLTSSVSGQHVVVSDQGTIIRDGDLCLDGRVYLTTGSGFAGSWSTGQYQSTIVAYDPGTYSVNYYDGYCNVNASVTLTAGGRFGCIYARDRADGNAPKELPKSFSVYPNPASEEISIELPMEVQEQTPIVFTDVLNKNFTVGAIEKGNYETKINTSQFNEGIYIIKIQIGKTLFVDKLIIRR